jgi:hypothetical protein
LILRIDISVGMQTQHHNINQSNMKKREFNRWIENNTVEYIKGLPDDIVELDYQINRRKDELDLLPTTDDKMEMVKHIYKTILDKEKTTTQNER